LQGTLIMLLCFYCGSTFEGGKFTAREMMFGTRECFEYAQCAKCGSCRLVTPLDDFDLSSHYPNTYYSFAKENLSRVNLKQFLLKKRNKYLFGKFDFIGYIVNLLKPSKYYSTLRRCGFNIDDSVLDVGTGNGQFLVFLREHGFHKLYGCDAFIEKSLVKSDIEIKKCSIEEMSGLYDFIFFNHSFEHLFDPLQGLSSARSLQATGSSCIIRCPTTSSLAFQRYRENWVQLDPPRHISIPSREGMRSLAESAGYSLEAMIDDSTGFQFWGSEQYTKDIPLTDEKSYRTNPKASIFSQSKMARFEHEAKEANKIGQGDQTAFVLRAI
jgi:SAM-dependent methyltransferase